MVLKNRGGSILFDNQKIDENHLPEVQKNWNDFQNLI